MKNVVKRLTYVGLFFLSVSVLSAEETTKLPYFTSGVYFSGSLKVNNTGVEAFIIDKFLFEGTLHWTEYTTLYARARIDNSQGQNSTVIFGSNVDQRYGEHNPVVFDVLYVKSRLSGEIGWDGPISLDLLVGSNSGGTLNQSWTRFNFENYRLSGIDGATVRVDIGYNDRFFLDLAVNPAFGTSNTVWRGITGTVSDGVDFLAAASMRYESFWVEIYWDSYANSVAFNQGTELSLFGIGGWWGPVSLQNLHYQLFGRLEYGLSKVGTKDDHLRFGAATGLVLPVLSGLDLNFSINGYFIDRNEVNLGFDTELLFIKQVGLFAAFGGIKILEDPQFVYEVGVGGHLAFLDIYVGYSDHKGGNEGWFKGAFDTTQNTNNGFFFRLVVDV